MTQPIATTDANEQPTSASWDAILKLPLQDWQVRLVEEANELEVNLTKLNAFIAKIENDHPHRKELINQSLGMSIYLRALNNRLRIEGIDTSPISDALIESTTERAARFILTYPADV